MVLFTTVLHVMLSLLLILIILLQPGKDSADIFGGGQGNKMYGARAQSNPLGKATTLVAVMFMCTSITLAWYSSASAQADSDILDDIKILEAELTKDDLEFQVPKLPAVNSSSLMTTPIPTVAPSPEESSENTEAGTPDNGATVVE